MAAGLVAAALWIYGTAGADRWLTHLAFLGLAAYRLLPAVQQVFAALARIHAERAAFDGIVEDLRARVDARRKRAARGADRRVARAAATGDSPRRRVVPIFAAARAAASAACRSRFPPARSSGFVGPNGAGKTTLAELMLGLLAPDAGRIEVDGVALDADNRDAWLDTVAYVAAAHRARGRHASRRTSRSAPLPDDVDLERVLEAARAAQLEPVIEAMPDGVATVIGENGAQLSGGQRQRVGIARALYRRASLLVVDEGTNALDTLTEAEIMTLLGTLRGTCTIMLIGHRPSCARRLRSAVRARRRTARRAARRSRSSRARRSARSCAPMSNAAADPFGERTRARLRARAQRARRRLHGRKRRRGSARACRRSFRRLAEAPARAPSRTRFIVRLVLTDHPQTWARGSAPPRARSQRRRAGYSAQPSTRATSPSWMPPMSRALVCVSKAMLRHRYHARYELIELAFLTLACARAIARAAARGLRRRERQRRAAHGRERSRQEHAEPACFGGRDAAACPRTARSSRSTACA